MTMPMVLLVAALAAQQLPARDTPRPPAKGAAVIKGFVVDALTGAPVRRAIVRVSGGGDPQQSVTADAEGRFELRELPAGKLFVSAGRHCVGSGDHLQASYGSDAAPEFGARGRTPNVGMQRAH